MKAYSEMMDAVWNINALVGGIQTSKVLCNDILLKQLSYKSALLNSELDEGAVAFWKGSVKEAQSELNNYLKSLQDLQDMLDTVMEGSVQ